MKAPILISLALGAMAAGAVFFPFGAAEVAQAQPDAPQCVVEVRAENPYRNYGYDHIVNLKNTCDIEVECRVYTNVDRTPVSTTVGAKAERSVLIRRGAPRGEFTAYAECTEK
jgi:hypothetical protein